MAQPLSVLLPKFVVPIIAVFILLSAGGRPAGAQELAPPEDGVTTPGEISPEVPEEATGPLPIGDQPPAVRTPEDEGRAVEIDEEGRVIGPLGIESEQMPPVEATEAEIEAIAGEEPGEPDASELATGVEKGAPNRLTEWMNDAVSRANAIMGAVLFYDVARGAVQVPAVDRDGAPVIDPDTGEQVVNTVRIPMIVFVLAFGAIFFTFFFRFINIRGFRHSFDVIRGKYHNPEDRGEISHFRALTSALSATVGLGNIAGVALAIRTGGPGAVFWMMSIAIFGMTSKFSSCTLAQLYRQTNADGTISGGPMYYLDLAYRTKGKALAKFGKVLAVMYAIMVMGGSIGGGNMFQANQSFEAVYTTFPFIPKAANWIFGIFMATMVGLVVIGGIKRIGAATARIVPFMCGLYIVMALYILALNWRQLDDALAQIFTMAFSENAFFGGIVGVMVIGIQRAAFSNEAGLGSSAIAHAAAKTEEPVREGIVAMLEPFIDTILVCTMTASVVVITGAWSHPELQSTGTAITTYAFGTQVELFRYILAICVLLFAYSTMISWCYYGERGWIYLLDHFGGAGLRTVAIFRIIFVFFVFVGAVTSLGPVLDFSDLMILSMAFPNILGSIFLAPIVLKRLQDYWGRYKAGEIKPVQ